MSGLSKLKGVRVEALATAAPEGILSSDRAAEIMADLAATNKREVNRVKAAARLSGINQRHCAIAENAPGGDLARTTLPIYENRPEGALAIPGTAERMAVYAREAPKLAERAVRDALKQAGLSPDTPTHLVTASCTGFFAPGLDLALKESLGLRPDIARTHIGFMGCHAAINVCAASRALALANPGAVVLAVCVELCALHFQYSVEREAMVPNMLFGDGAAAMILRAEEDEPEKASSSLRLLDTASCLLPDSADAMTWTIGDAGFRMTLASRTPDLIAANLRPLMEDFLDKRGLAIEDVGAWAIHPGGPRVVESAAGALGLREDQTEASRRVLRERGNMSSPTVLFILKELLGAGASGPVVALAFGPGLAAEMALFEAKA